MSSETAEPSARSPAQPELTPRKVLYAVVGLGLHLVAGFFMLVSGLVAPPWAVLLMLFVWAVLLASGIRLWRVKPWVTIGFPVLAFAIWIGTIALGGAFLDWNA
ncbi:MAG: hypothetical protein OEM97_03685 [Acidimicrobiia bacterium]|nr:hypothetical protein [Acidimicrobiia bacterium]